MAKKAAAAAPKIDFLKLLLEKGDTYGLAIAGVIALLMVGYGIMTATSYQTGKEVAKNLDSTAKEITQKVNTGPGTPPPDLPTELTQPPQIVKADLDKYRNQYAYFDLLERGPAKRIQPKVLPPSEFQVDFVRAPLALAQVVTNANGTSVWIRQVAKIDANSAKELSGLQKSLVKSRVPQTEAQKRQEAMQQEIWRQLQSANNPAGGNPGGVNPGGSEGPPAGGMAGYPGLGGGMRTQEQNSAFNPAAPLAPGFEKQLQLIDVSKLSGAKGVLAEFLTPQRMVIISASFPYKQQLEEFRKALRKPSLDQLDKNTDAVIITGFDVERRIKPLSGKTFSPWNKLDYIGNSIPIRSRMAGVMIQRNPAEDAKLKPIREFCKLMPLPRLAHGTYPPLELKTINDTVAAIEAAGRPATVLNPQQAILQGGGAAFEEPENPMNPGAGEGNPARPLPGGNEAPMANQELLLPDHILIRFYDVAIVPGIQYEYRLRMRLNNPNFGKKTEVAVPSFATDKEIVGEWVELGQKVSVPPEAFVYVMGGEVPPLMRNPPNGGTNADETVIQMHTWLEQIREDKASVEAIGDWVIADFRATKGEYIGHKKRVELPIWKPAEGAYIIKETDPPRATPNSPKLRGSVVDLSTRALVVDFKGGKVSYLPPDSRPGSLPLREEAGVEMLIMSPDGKLRVRNSQQDKDDPERIKREEDWKKWIEETKRRVPAATPENNPFASPRPGGR